jgi:Na+/H+-dicarboxylate symporter
MFNPKPLLASAAIAALLAAPALALDLSTDISIGAMPDDMTTMKAVEGSAFVGNEVRTKDQIVIGQVENVYEGSDGMPVAVITLNSDFGAKSSVKSFTVPLGMDTAADGSLTLGWTETELIAAISGNIDATAPANNETAPAEDSGG